MGHDSCRAVPGNDVWNRRTWGICEICILTETAKISWKSLHPELAKIPTSPVSQPLQIHSLQTASGSQITSQTGQPTGRRNLSCSCRNNGNAPAGCASFCSQQTQYQAPTSHRMSHPRGFLPEPARHGFAVALGPLPAALVPSLACLLACMGGQPTLRRAGLFLLVFFAHGSTSLPTRRLLDSVAGQVKQSSILLLEYLSHDGVARYLPAGSSSRRAII